VTASSARDRALRALRRSPVAPIIRRAAATADAARLRVSAPDGRMQRVRERWSLATSAAPARPAARAGLVALAADVANLPSPPAMNGSVSVVLLVDDGDDTRDLRSFVSDAAEVIAVLHGDDARAPAFAATVLPARTGESPAAASARGAQHATADRICFLRASIEPIGAHVLARLASVLDGEIVAATPLLVHPVRARAHATPYDGRVGALGLQLAVENDAPVVVARGAGEAPDVSRPPAPVAGASAACLVVDRAAYEAAGELPDYADVDVAMFELCRRLRARGGTLVAVSEAVVVDHRPVASRSSLARPIRADERAWRTLIDDAGPALMREAAPLADGQLRIAITIAAPSRKVAPRWGDWHLAEAFADALRRTGHLVRVQTADAANDPAGRACDVHCIVRGLTPVRRTRGQRHVLWIISHPETIRTRELDDADLVLVASHRFAAELHTRTRTPVEPLLQATDPARFHPFPPDAAHRHDVTVVAKSRDEYRVAVADAIAAGLRPSIYGSGWEKFVDPSLVVSDYVDNYELARVYSSAGVVLNDHWDSMREWGFVSNRIFDALACGAPVISDDVPEVTELFAGAVPVFRDSGQLRALVDAALADPDAARATARRGMEIVLAGHTFERRAQQFLEALARHGLD
jgi:hypothetical protein